MTRKYRAQSMWRNSSRIDSKYSGSWVMTPSRCTSFPIPFAPKMRTLHGLAIRPTVSPTRSIAPTIARASSGCGIAWLSADSMGPLMSNRASGRSGRRRAYSRLMGTAMLQPPSTKRSSPSACTTASRSSAFRGMSRASGSAGAPERWKPRMSQVMTRTSRESAV